MNNIYLKVAANRIEIEKDTFTTGGSVDFDGCVFSFDSTWDSFIKTAVFGFGNADFVRVSLDDDSCKIPAVCLQKEGILKIGAYGVNEDGVVITTNAVAHRIEEGIGEENNWYEEDNYFVYNALKELEGSLEKYKGELEVRFNDLLRNIRNSGSISDKDVLPGEPDEWYYPSTFKDGSGNLSVSTDKKYQAYLDYILNTLVSDFPEYVSYKEIGEDSSGEYSIYAYTFEPLNYEKTVLITSGFHPEESIAIVALSHFLSDLCRNYRNDRTLSYIRSKVKLVVVPVVNPYGFVNKTALNSNGVDLQRNFPYKWDECASENKGSDPANQSEIYAIFDLLDEIYDDKLCAALDTDAGSFYYCGAMMFYPRFKDNCLSKLANVLKRYNYDADESDALSKTVIASSVNPSIGNFLAQQFNINTCSLRWSPVNYPATGQKGGITKFAELIGNTLYTLAENSSYASERIKLPFIRHISWRGTDESDVHYLFASDSPLKVPVSSYEFDAEKPCCLMLNGYVIIKATNYCNVKINPVLWQDDSPEQSYNDRLQTDAFAVSMPLSVGMHVVPLESVLQVYASDTNSQFNTVYPKKVRFTLATDIDVPSGACVVGYSFTFTAFESDSGCAVEISKPMGRAQDYTNYNDIPTHQIIYPKQTVRESDADYND